MDYSQDHLIILLHTFEMEYLSRFTIIWFDIKLKCIQTTLILGIASTALPSSVEKLDILVWVHSLCPA